MNLDRSVEIMCRHSPYNYAFNNPVFFIDPDGMMPLAGMQTGAVEHTGGFEVSNKADGSNAQHFSNVNDAFAAASEINASNNAQIYSDFFKNAADKAANADVSLDGGDDCGDCNNALHRNSEKAISLEKWTEKYRDWSQKDIALEGGKDKFGLPNGPDKDWSYVINPYDGNIMDMRHVVVVGYGMGEVKGLGAEIIQKIAGWFGKDPTNSAFDPQDRYSNNIGAAFHTYDFRKNGINMSFNFGNNFSEFLNKIYKK